MKTSELIKVLKRFGKVDSFTNLIEMRNDEGIICRVGMNKMFVVDTCFMTFDALDVGTRAELFRALTNYAMTPLPEREDEPKFKVHLWYGCNYLLNLDCHDGKLSLNDDAELSDYKTRFTKSEYEALRKNNPEHIAYLPPFDESDPRFEMVKDGGEE